MMRIADPTTLALTLIATVALLVSPACVESDPPDESTREAAAEMKTIALDVTLPEDTDPSEVEAIARSIERLGGADVAGAKVEAERGEEGLMILTVQLWGAGLEAPDALIAALRAEHPELVDTPIAVQEREGAPEQDAMTERREDETPEETKARIIDELRAKGIEGEIVVDVVDDEHGRKVEVRVEDTKRVE